MKRILCLPFLAIAFVACNEKTTEQKVEIKSADTEMAQGFSTNLAGKSVTTSQNPQFCFTFSQDIPGNCAYFFKESSDAAVKGVFTGKCSLDDPRNNALGLELNCSDGNDESCKEQMSTIYFNPGEKVPSDTATELDGMFGLSWDVVENCEKFSGSDQVPVPVKSKSTATPTPIVGAFSTATPTPIVAAFSTATPTPIVAAFQVNTLTQLNGTYVVGNMTSSSDSNKACTDMTLITIISASNVYIGNRKFSCSNGGGLDDSNVEDYAVIGGDVFKKYTNGTATTIKVGTITSTKLAITLPQFGGIKSIEISIANKIARFKQSQTVFSPYTAEGTFVLKK
jgi:hypothetical protein